MENNKLLWWLMGLVGTALVALAGFWMNSVAGSVGGLQTSLTEVAKELQRTNQIWTERVVKLETYSQMQREEVAAQRATLARIEARIEELKK